MTQSRTSAVALLSRRTLLVGAAGLSAVGIPITASFGQAPPLWAAWKDLLNLLPDAASLAAARKTSLLPDVKFEVQKIEDAGATKVNFDRYAVEVSRLPTGYTAPKLLEHMRQKINDFFDHKLSTVAGINDKDDAKWKEPGDAPLGTVMVFKIPKGPLWEEGAVVTSVAKNTLWIFTPVKISFVCPGEHPVSGNREFGYRAMGGSKYEFYTRAADRATGICFGLGEDVIYNGADALWQSWQSKLAAFINSNKGGAKVTKPVFFRPTWEEVKKSGLFTRAG